MQCRLYRFFTPNSYKYYIISILVCNVDCIWAIISAHFVLIHFNPCMQRRLHQITWLHWGTFQFISILVCNVDCISLRSNSAYANKDFNPCMQRRLHLCKNMFRSFSVIISILVCNVDCICKNKQKKQQHHIFYFIAIYIHIKVTKAISYILYIKY